MGFGGVELGIALPALEPFGFYALGIVAVVVRTIVVGTVVVRTSIIRTAGGVVDRGGDFRVVLRRHRSRRNSELAFDFTMSRKNCAAETAELRSADSMFDLL